jgi:hypothetical protein
MARPTIRYLSPPRLSPRRLSIRPLILPKFPIRPIPTPATPVINNLRTIILQVLSMPFTRESRR